MNHDTLGIVISLATGLFTAGVAWGTTRATVKGLAERLDQHIEVSGTWRAAQETRVENLTNAILNLRRN